MRRDEPGPEGLAGRPGDEERVLRGPGLPVETTPGQDRHPQVWPGQRLPGPKGVFMRPAHLGRTQLCGGGSGRRAEGRLR